jgi:hypothetical protein
MNSAIHYPHNLFRSDAQICLNIAASTSGRPGADWPIRLREPPISGAHEAHGPTPATRSTVIRVM